MKPLIKICGVADGDNLIKLIKIEKIIIPSKCIGFMKNITVNSLLNDIVKD